MQQHEIERLNAFFAQSDEAGKTNAEKAGYDASQPDQRSAGVITDEAGRFIGLGIHIQNENVYPIEQFELFLRDKDLTGRLDLSRCRDVVFIDVYRNRISAADVHGMDSLRILGLQCNEIAALDVGTLFACQGIDVGKNRLSALDVSNNGELVELYIHGNRFTNIDLSHNPKLKYFWCNDNRISMLDTTANPLLRHLDCTNNPLTGLVACAPGSDGAGKIALHAEAGGYVGVKFCPVYNEKWKETGEWRQTYFAYPNEGYAFDGWYDAQGGCVCTLAEWVVTYGQCADLRARFCKR